MLFPFLLPSPSSFPPTLWSGSNNVFITLIRSSVLGCLFEVWFPVSSGQERILGTAGFLLLFLCIYNFTSLSFLFFCFICLCFPLLSKPASLSQVIAHPQIIITHLFFFFSILDWSFSFLYFASSSQSFLPPPFICFLSIFLNCLVLTHVFWSF